MLAPSLYRCSLPSDLWLYVGICSKGRGSLALPPAGKKVTSQDENLLGRFMAGSDTVCNWLALMKEITTVKTQKNLSERVFIFSCRGCMLPLPHTGLQAAHSPTPPALGQWRSGTSGHPQPPSAGAELSSSSLCCSAPTLGRSSALLQPWALCYWGEKGLGEGGRLTATAGFASITLYKILTADTIRSSALVKY